MVVKKARKDLFYCRKCKRTRRKNEKGEGNPGEDRGDYPIGDNEDEKREPNTIGIP